MLPSIIRNTKTKKTQKNRLIMNWLEFFLINFSFLIVIRKVFVVFSNINSYEETSQRVTTFNYNDNNCFLMWKSVLHVKLRTLKIFKQKKKIVSFNFFHHHHMKLQWIVVEFSFATTLMFVHHDHQYDDENKEKKRLKKKRFHFLLCPIIAA